MSPLIIGTCLIEFGMSLAEMLTNIYVSLKDQGAMGRGNVIG